MGTRGVWPARLAFIVVLGLAGRSHAGKAPDVSALRAQLAAPDSGTAGAAAAALGTIRTPAALDALLDALALGLAPDVAAAALDAVARHGAERSLPVLVAYAHHRNPGVRAHAVQALGALTASPPAGQALLAALGDEEAEVRGTAGRLLAWRRDARAVPALLALFASGDEVAGPPLAALAGADEALKVAELAGKAPDPLVAHTLGRMALRKDLGPEATYVGIVRALGAIPGDDSLAELRAVAAAAGVPGAARKEAQALVEERAK